MTDDEVDAAVEAAKRRFIDGEIDAVGLDRAVGALLGEPMPPDPDDEAWRDWTIDSYPPRGPLPAHLVEVVNAKPTRRRARKPEWYDSYAAWKAEQAD